MMSSFRGGGGSINKNAEDSQEEKSAEGLINGSKCRGKESGSSAWLQYKHLTDHSRPVAMTAAHKTRRDRGSSTSSAPVDIPDRSKILKMSLEDHGREWCIHSEDDENEMIPPHEYLTRRLARTQIASFSMCEGVGRTLKGRDLTKVRNAILSKTGFLE